MNTFSDGLWATIYSFPQPVQYIIIFILIIATIFFSIKNRRWLIKTIIFFIIEISNFVRFYIGLQLGVLKVILYLIISELIGLMDKDSGRSVVAITRQRLGMLYVEQIIYYNAIFFPIKFNVIQKRYVKIVLIILLIKFIELTIGFLNIGMVFNSNHLLIAILALTTSNLLNTIMGQMIWNRILNGKREEVASAEEQPSGQLILHQLALKQSKGKTTSVMQLWQEIAPVVARIQRRDHNIKPFFLVYKSGENDYYCQVDDKGNGIAISVWDIAELANNLSIFDSSNQMSQYSIYYRNGRGFQKTPYMTRDQLRVVVRAVMSIYESGSKSNSSGNNGSNGSKLNSRLGGGGNYMGTIKK